MSHSLIHPLGTQGSIPFNPANVARTDAAQTFTGTQTFSGTIAGAAGQHMTLAAGATNQNIALTPSGTGTVDIVGTGALRFTTAAAVISLRSSGADYVGIRLSGAGTGTFGFGAGTVYPTRYEFLTNAASIGPIIPSSGNLLLGGLTTDDGVNVLQNPGATLSAVYKGGTNALMGAGAVSVATDTTKYTTAGTGDALTLANGTDGQIKRVILDVLTSGGHTAVLTPTTKTGFSTVTFTAAGQSVTMEYVTTRGWIVIGSYGVTIAP